MKALLAFALAAALLAAPTARAFDNTEPDASKQWYLTADHAWDAWPTMPQLAPVKVAVVDSGIDYGHPEFAGQIAGGKSFVPNSSWKEDTEGHGTYLAGLIAANPTNGIGMAGMAFNAKLLIAKVVNPDGSISLPGEAAAIRWAANHGARVINLSLGGVRDPVDQQLDTYSAAEQAAVDYAYSKGAVIVAAVGNASESVPWTYADYPAALPHVIGVSALRRNGSVPAYSNRDPTYVDIAAPGDDLFSTIPRELVDPRRIACHSQAYTNCGPFELRQAIGTSFAAPQVSAAAALLIGQDPALTPDQVTWLLERSADDVNASNGCLICPVGRDSLTGWGRLDVAAALTKLAEQAFPPPDHYEPNDNAGSWAKPFGPPRAITASVDFWDDQIDVYRLALQKGQRLYVRLTPPTVDDVKLLLWRPGTESVDGLRVTLGNEAAQARAVAGQERIAFVAQASGSYYVEVKCVAPSPDPFPYRLAVATRQ